MGILEATDSLTSDWNIIALAKKGWCMMFHEEITLPIHGQYTCLKCHQVFKVDYE